MANGKTFADMKKPVRQPTPEQIAAFEETGRASPVLDPALLAVTTQKSASPDLPSGDAETRKHANADLQEPAKPQTQKAVATDRREHADTENSVSVNPQIPEHGNPPLQEHAEAEPRGAVEAETSKSANIQTRIPAPVVRLTIDLAETDHTRFKTACVMTKRKMVDEVRAFIERRTVELEGEAGRPR